MNFDYCFTCANCAKIFTNQPQSSSFLIGERPLFNTMRRRNFKHANNFEEIMDEGSGLGLERIFDFLQEIKLLDQICEPDFEHYWNKKGKRVNRKKDRANNLMNFKSGRKELRNVQ